jgi:hypothetical protein
MKVNSALPSRFELQPAAGIASSAHWKIAFTLMAVNAPVPARSECPTVAKPTNATPLVSHTGDGLIS